jgi:hypothetical protein
MRRSTLWMCALLVTTTFGCEQVKKQAATVGATVKAKVELVRERFFHKKPPADRSAVPTPAAPVAPAPAAPPESPAPEERAPAPAEPVPQIPVTGAATHRDVPYVSQDTGTIFPGMAERDVYSLWGAPAAVRHRGEYTFLFFPNGCEYSCGMMDVVTLRGGQVTDAVLRWPGHGYGGHSTSPTGGTPEGPPPGGDNLIISPDTTQMPDTVQTQPTTP